ncbi:MAG TPA: HNH endonuclease [Geothrix sp.]|jgi:5-methylcytosine-specific restriction endonuclease McrA
MLKGRERHGAGEVIAVDRNYVPMQEVSRRRALCAVVAGRAHVLNPATFERHRNLDGSLELIIFPHAQACSDSKLLIGRLERRVMRRDHYLCQYEGCQRKATTVDHVVPLCQGGSTTWQNLVGCCLSCNQIKGGRTPDQAGMILKRQPKGPRAHLFERFEELLKRASAA